MVVVNSMLQNVLDNKIWKVDGGRRNGFCFTIIKISCLVVGLFYDSMQFLS